MPDPVDSTRGRESRPSFRPTSQPQDFSSWAGRAHQIRTKPQTLTAQSVVEATLTENSLGERTLPTSPSSRWNWASSPSARCPSTGCYSTGAVACCGTLDVQFEDETICFVVVLPSGAGQNRKITIHHVRSRRYSNIDPRRPRDQACRNSSNGLEPAVD